MPRAQAVWKPGTPRSRAARGWALPPLTACNLALEKMRHFVRLSHDLHYLDARRYEFAARALDETGR